MSWSPDGREVLLYQRVPGRFVAMAVASGSVRVLVAPPGAVRPMGWAGTDVVWLVGGTGHERLVVSRPDGSDRHEWVRLDLNGLALRTVQWSQRLAGTAR
jgi:hypothetical protein